MFKTIKFDVNGLSTEVKTDFTTVEGDSDVYDVEKSETGLYKKLANDSIVPITREERELEMDKTLDYKQLRKREYPSSGDQLAEIWGVLERLTDLSNSENLNKIKAVKVKHPK